MSLKKSESVPARTRQLLLEAAGQVFADVGFHDATVREISLKAGTNFAAINYHFGDKKNLYLEVLHYAVVTADEKYPLHGGLEPDASAEARLQAFIHSFLLRLLDAGPISWSGKLVARELIKPTLALESIIAESIQPINTEIARIVKTLLGSKASQEKIRHCTLSVVSQCVFYQRSRQVLARLHPEEGFSPREIEKLARHIAEFSLGGLQHMANN